MPREILKGGRPPPVRRDSRVDSIHQQSHVEVARRYPLPLLSPPFPLWIAIHLIPMNCNR